MSDPSEISEHAREAAEREPAERSLEGEREAGEPAERPKEDRNERKPASLGMRRQS